ncbi:MAG: 50S ribosomal protein L25 [Ignavibacteriales bacterium]
MSEISLNVKKREISTKGVVNQLRKSGYVPGIFYSHGVDPVPFSVSEISLKPLVFTAETHLVNLVIDNEQPIKCILKDVQFDPVSDRVIHVDLQGISANEMISLQVPVLITGTAIGIKQGGVLQQYLHKLDIECLPANIPEHLEIDVTKLNIGDAIHVRDLKFENINILTSEEASVVAVSTMRVEAETAAPAAEEVKEPEVIAKGKVEEE